jgi:hypothetical protein
MLVLSIGCGGKIVGVSDAADAADSGSVTPFDAALACLPQPGTVLAGDFQLSCGAGTLGPGILIQANGYVAGAAGPTAADVQSGMRWSCASVVFKGCEAIYTDCTTASNALPGAPGECKVVSTDVMFTKEGTQAQGTTIIDCAQCPVSTTPTAFLPFP